MALGAKRAGEQVAQCRTPVVAVEEVLVKGRQHDAVGNPVAALDNASPNRRTK